MKEMPLDLLEESIQEVEGNGEGNSEDGIALFGDSDDAFLWTYLFQMLLIFSPFMATTLNCITHNE